MKRRDSYALVCDICMKRTFTAEEVFATKYETHSTDPLPHSREVLSSNIGEETGHAD
jgi:hypothetical protein